MIPDDQGVRRVESFLLGFVRELYLKPGINCSKYIFSCSL